MSVNRNAPLFLSDGTPVEFVKVTSRGNFQVRIPSSHPLGEIDPLRIFKPASGAHYKNAADGLTLTNAASASGSASTLTPGPVDSTQPMFLSDGTPVTLSKVTRRGRIQVKLPDTHADAAGQENGLLYESTTGARYKDRHSLFLTNTAPSASASASASASTPATEQASYSLSVNDSIVDDGFDTFDAAEEAAFDLLDRDTRSVSILKVSTTVAGVVGLSTTRA